MGKQLMDQGCGEGEFGGRMGSQNRGAARRTGERGRRQGPLFGYGWGDVPL